MHHRLLITLDFPPFDDSIHVRRKVYDRLMADDSFCGTGGRFGSPLCDWFVIGGRWSGLLAEITIGAPEPSRDTRSGYEELGYPDDAMILTRGLYDALLAEYAGQCTCSEFADLDDEALCPDFVGRKWLVVIDYHN